MGNLPPPAVPLVDGNSKIVREWYDKLSTVADSSSVTELSDLGDVDDSLKDDGKGLWWDADTNKHIYAWASPKSVILNLRDFMDAHYGVGNWTYYNGATTGSDCTPALEAACQVHKDENRRGQILVPGRFRLDTSPDPTLLAGNTLVGPGGPLSDGFVYTATTGFALEFNGAAGFTGGGTDGIGLFCRPESGPLNTNTYGLALTVAAGPNSAFQYAASFSNYKNMFIQGLDGYSFAFNIYGPLETKVVDVPHAIAQGGRVISFENIQCFAGWQGAYYFSNFCDLRINGLTSSGAAPVSDIYFTGGGTPGLDDCNGVTVVGLVCNGYLFLLNMQNFYIQGQCDNVDLQANAFTGAGFLKANTTTGPGLGADTTNFHIF